LASDDVVDVIAELQAYRLLDALHLQILVHAAWHDGTSRLRVKNSSVPIFA
jgi:hypothetical protein